LIRVPLPAPDGPVATKTVFLDNVEKD
jgi:hypothetical protein